MLPRQAEGRQVCSRGSGLLWFIVLGLLPLLGDAVLLLARGEPTCAGEVTHESWSLENAAQEHSLLLTRGHSSS